ncbi:MAG TPA: hypothetical protein PK010_05240, partial [Alphaproteobacteria bacterium]|nr:hypothetical protein [Alphaproteobacteria bacterium]
KASTAHPSTKASTAHPSTKASTAHPSTKASTVKHPSTKAPTVKSSTVTPVVGPNNDVPSSYTTTTTEVEYSYGSGMQQNPSDQDLQGLERNQQLEDEMDVIPTSSSTSSAASYAVPSSEKDAIGPNE